MEILNKEQAIAFDKAQTAKDWTLYECLKFQLPQPLYCIHPNVFIAALDHVFGRWAWVKWPENRSSLIELLKEKKDDGTKFSDLNFEKPKAWFS